MNVEQYENDVERGLIEAVEKLDRINDLVLYAFNIWTDPDAGVTEFSADTRENSDRVVHQIQEWQRKEYARLRASGRERLASLVRQPYVRNREPTEFAYKGIVRIAHADWAQVVAGAANRWDVIEPVLTRLRDKAICLINGRLVVEPDAEVSIGTRTDWYDRPARIRS